MDTARASMIGSRIRERRVMAGMKQADLARAAGISASYLNLIEHNRRRIGGKTLNQLADVLKVPAGQLAEGAEAALVDALTQAAKTAVEGDTAETDRVEEFAGRFPGWAQLVAQLARERSDLTRAVNALTDRIAHDPELATSLHEVISTVTAIRSTASILAGGALEPQWQSRFHRNINEDSERLATEAEALVRYLEGAPGAEMAVRTPLEQVHAFMAAHDHHFSELEGAGGSARVASIVNRSDVLVDDTARRIANALLLQYVQDARALPMRDMEGWLRDIGADVIQTAPGQLPQTLADLTGQPLAAVARRLASLPEDMVGPVGLFICDGTGRMMFQKPVLGLDLIRPAATCHHWPIYEVLAHPGQVVERRVQQGDVRVLTLAMSQELRAATVSRPAERHAHMLILPDAAAQDQRDGAIWPVGASCPSCTMGLCDAG
ncbi:MAG: helix-turn-helix domain-containing protein [Pseudomonadota bacterium]